MMNFGSGHDGCNPTSWEVEVRDEKFNIILSYTANVG